MIRVTFLAISILFTYSGIWAQTVYKVLDWDTQQPIDGAIVEVYNAQGDKLETNVSDVQGLIQLTIVKPAYVLIQHVAYESLKTDLRQTSFEFHLKPKINQLDDIVITAQYTPRSVKNSVYDVDVIRKDRITTQGTTDLQGVLANQLNVQFDRDNATGRSGINIQGLNGQYVKVLVDGVPINGRGGVLNDIDLGQIDVQNIERIEVVEGPMAVNYGADALAGVINIITTQTHVEKIDVKVGIHEESVGKEYTLGDQGIHNQSVSLGYQITPKWYAQANGRYFRFGGWKGDAEGREHAWYPKDQYFGGFLARYENKKSSIQYRASYVDEKLQNLGARVTPQLEDPFAIDEDYATKIWRHFLQGDWSNDKIKVDGVFSFNRFDQSTRQVSKNLITFRETLTSDEEQDDIFYQTWFTRETMSSSLWQDKLDWQLGFEGRYETAGGTKLSNGDKEQTELGAFSSVELTLGDLKVRPGLRITHNTNFTTNPSWSINMKYAVTEKLQLRSAYGRGFRAPSLRELYHEFIDANHNIVGNPDLNPEYSHNINVKLSYTLSALGSTLGVAGFYNQIEDMITFFRFDNVANGETTYLNQDLYKTQGINVTQEYAKNRTTVHLGFSYTGRYQALSETQNVDEFYYSPALNARINQRFKFLGDLAINAFYKYNGSVKEYRLNNDDEVRLVGLNGYHLLDITLSKTLFKSVDLIAGAKNVVNVTNLGGTSTNGAHGGGVRSPVGYGRSYFIKINYHFSK